MSAFDEAPKPTLDGNFLRIVAERAPYTEKDQLLEIATKIDKACEDMRLLWQATGSIEGILGIAVSMAARNVFLSFGGK